MFETDTPQQSAFVAAYRERWQLRRGSDFLLVGVDLAGDRRIETSPDIPSSAVQGWLEDAGYVFHRLLPATRVSGTPSR